MANDYERAAYGSYWGGCGVPGHGYLHGNMYDGDENCYDFTFSGGRPRISCKTTKECVKTYKTYYKMYKISTYRLYKVCPHCGLEFDFYGCRGICPRCR